MGAQRIKGITIEIDGDATGLDKALKDVNSSINTTQKALKDVNKLLQLDPGNVELIAQKQRLLGDAVESTREKLNKLKIASEQANEALNAGTMNQGQYDALQREIADTTNELKKLEEQQKKVAGSASNLSMGASITDMGNKITSAGQKMAAASAIAVAGIASFVNAASDQEEAMNKVEVVFGTSADAVKNFADTAINSCGLAASSALNAAALFGDMGTSMGLSQDAAAEMSVNLVQLAGDLASFKNISADQAMTALNGIFTGETESLKGLGVVMTEATLKAYAMEEGFSKNYDAMTQAEKVQLRYQYVLNQTSSAQGDFARTSDGTANSIRTFQESVKEMAAALGEQLLPIVTPIIQGITKIINAISNLPPWMQKIIGVVALIVAVLGPLLIIIGTLMSSIGNIITMAPTIATAIGTIATAFSSALAGIVAFVTANAAAIAAVVAIIAALALLAYAIYEVVQHWDEISAAATEAAQATKDAWSDSAIGQQTSRQFNAAKDAVVDACSAMKNTWSSTGHDIVGLAQSIFEGVKSGVATYMAETAGLTKDQLEVIVGYFGGKAKSILDSVVSTFTQIKNEMVSKMREAVEGVIDYIKSLPDRAREALNGLADKVAEPFENLINKAKNWGKDLVDNFADGILKNNKAVDATTKMAQDVQDRIGFSEPDKGPLSNFHTYAPDMIDLWVKGIRQNMYKVSAATNQMAATMNPAKDTSVAMNNSTVALAGAGGGTINVYVDHISEVSDLIRIQKQAQQMNRMGARI